MTALRIAAVLGAVLATMATSRVDPLPEPDLCEGGATSGATSVEIGHARGGRAIVLGEDDVVELVVGGQGTDMLPLRYRAVGTSAQCISVTLRVSRCEPMGARCDDPDATSEVIYDQTRSLRAYPELGDVTTMEDLAILEGRTARGGRLLLEAEVAGATTSFHVWSDEDGTVDAGPDAALDAGIDGPLPDAATTDAI